VREVFPEAEVVEIPVADGGDGTLEALVTAHRGDYRPVEVEGPLGDPVRAAYGLIDSGRTAVVELASASGLALLPPARRDPRRTSTYGFGQLLEAARKAGVDHLVAGIDITGVDAGWRLLQVDVACDVTNPLTGPEGASFVYGPQKGADRQTVRMLDSALAHLADVIERDLGKRVAEIPGAGAAGGTGAGLIAFLDGKLLPGAALVVEASGFDRQLKGAQLVITGEGRVDSQTAYGKAPGEVARRAQAAGIPTLLLAGSKGPGWEALTAIGVRAVVTLAEEGDNLGQLMQNADQALTRAAVRACRSHPWE
jgi:glycerate kinase